MKKALFLVVLLAPFALVSPAQACSPAPDWPPSPSVNLERQDVAFIGTVKSIMQDKSSIGRYHITFEVEETYKGFLGETVTIHTESSSAACGYDDGYKTFKAGTVWVMYATGNSADGYHTNHLSLNSSHTSVAEAKASLAKAGIVKEEMLVCTTEYAPICGRDLKTGTVRTFGNSCEVNAGKAVKLYDGECKTDAAPKRDLSQGTRGTEVTWLQKHLIQANMGTAARALAGVGPTGYFGMLTRNALAEFQKGHGIAPAFGYFGAKTRAFLGTQVTPMPIVAETGKFTGTITAVDTACFSDGVCSATIGGKKVIIIAGMRVPPIPAVGSLKGVDSIGDLEGKIGSKAEVYAAATAEEGYQYTLYGSTDYYVRLID